MSAYRLLCRFRLVLAISSALVLGLLAWNLVQSRSYDPLEATRLEQMQLRLAANPKDDALRDQLRTLDRQVRERYLHHRRVALQGLALLAVLASLLTLAHAAAETLRPRSYSAEPEATEILAQTRAKAAQGAYVLATALGGILVVLATLGRNDPLGSYVREGMKPHVTEAPGQASGSSPPAPPVAQGPLPPADPLALGKPPLAGSLPATPPTTRLEPETPAGAGTQRPSSPAVRPAPSKSALPDLEPCLPAGLEADWPKFRGPAGNGVAAARPPLPGKGLKVLWKVAVPLPGWNSPIVVKGRVLLAMADSTRREVAAFDARTGELLWRTAIPYQGPLPRVSQDTGFAPSTMASDGERAYAIFPDGLLVGLDLGGGVLWTRSFGPFENPYGHASSLLCHGKNVIVQLDQGSDPEERKSRLVALDGATGKSVWQVDRAVSASWATPLLLRAGTRELLVAMAPPLVCAYDPDTGKEVWRVEGLGGEPAPCPAFDEHRVYAGNLGSYLFAINPSGEGDITRTGVLWDTSDYLPDIVSPLAFRESVYLLGPDGTLACLRAKDGSLVWEHRIGLTKASPTAVGDAIWLVTDAGRLVVLQPGDAYRELGAMELGEVVRASPAFVGDRVYVRGQDHLFCLGP